MSCTKAKRGGRVRPTQKRAGVRVCAEKHFCVLIFSFFFIKEKEQEKQPFVSLRLIEGFCDRILSIVSFPHIKAIRGSKDSPTFTFAVNR
jgi:hypothetical protein